MKKGSIKNTRINAEVRKEIQSILMNGLKVTADLRYCTVYVSVYGGPEAEEQTLEGLRKASGYIRSELARTVNLRITPELRFAADRSIAYGAHIDSVLDELKKTENWDQDGEAEQDGEADEQDTSE